MNVENTEQRNDISYIKGKVEEMSKRQDDTNERLNHLGDKIDKTTRWLIGILLGILIPMWISIIVTILFKS